MHSSHLLSAQETLLQEAALTGTNLTWSSRKPIPCKAAQTSDFTSSKRELLHWACSLPSILLIATTMPSRPALRASTACSRAWPPRASPASSSIWFAETTSKAMSACDTTVQACATHRFCPGGSNNVNRRHPVEHRSQPESGVVVVRPERTASFCSLTNFSKTLRSHWPVAWSRAPNKLVFPAPEWPSRATVA